MKLSIKQTECAGKLFWIAKDTDPSWFYHGPFVDEAAAKAFAQLKNRENLKKLLEEARENWKARHRLQEEPTKTLGEMIPLKF